MSASCSNNQQFCRLIFTLAFVPVVNFQHTFNFVQVGGLRGGMMVDHVSNKGISAHGHLFWAVLMSIFILGTAHLEYLGRLLLFCKCGHVAAACNVVCDKPNRLSS